jgi:hypothetical protein
MATPDGSITIDTRISDKGFNSGLKKITASASGALNGILFAALKIGTKIKAAMSNAVAAVSKFAQVMKKVLLTSLLVLGASIGAIFAGLRDSFTNLLENNLKGSRIAADIEDIKNKFTELKFSIVLAFLPLIQAAIPYIKMAMDWLIRMLNIVAQITAAFLGQKQVLQVVPGSAAKLAKETEKTKKAAQGALAAFDQINVLQKSDQDGATPIDSNIPEVATKLVPITDEILSKVQAIKDEIAAWFADPIGKLKEIWGKIVKWFYENVINPITEWWDGIFSEEGLTKIGTVIFKVFTVVGNLIRAAFVAIGTIIQKVFVAIGTAINTVFTLIGTIINNMFTAIGTGINNAFTFIGTIINNVFIAIQNVIRKIVEYFGIAWNYLKTNSIASFAAISGGFMSVFTGMREFFRGIVNGMIDLLNGLVGRALEAINIMTQLLNFSFVPVYGGGTTGGGSAGGGTGSRSARRVPHLATGAVIPPNAKFAAILGDQTSGRNLEAPEGLIRKIIQEEVGSIKAEFEISFGGSLAALVRELKPHIDKENVRVGKSLVSGKTVTK